MGIAHKYECRECGHRFTASEDFNCGMIGEVFTPVVCSVHGIGGARVGVNLARGEKITSDIRNTPSFPCETCGVDSPRWDRKSCPSCGVQRVQVGGMILWD